MAGNARRELESVMRSLLKRCQVCPPEKPTCAGYICGSGQQCVYVAQGCDNCAFVKCAPISDDPTISNTPHHRGPNVGAIAGGVVGGVVFVVILIFVIWKFCLKGRRQQYEEAQWLDANPTTQEKADSEFVSRRNTRASTHTVASMASSVLTRASNIIQIAYIPGVTNRSGPGSPDLLVPPVPPIPAMSPTSASGFSTPYAASEQHFFVPDLRDSMASSTTDGTYSIYARNSLAPSLARTSVASTVYRQNAIVSPLPAQTIVRGKAAVVSVKSSGSNSPTGSDTPPVPQIDPKHSTLRIQMPRMTTSSASSLSRDNSVRSTATLGKVRALNITKKKTLDVTPPKSSVSTSSPASTPDGSVLSRPFTEISIDSTDDEVAHARARRTAHADSESESDDDDHSRANRSLLRASASTRDSEMTESPLQSPFSDSSASDYSRPDMPHRDTYSSVGLRPGPPMSPIREESSKRTSRASHRTQSPFSDDNRSDL